MVNIQIVSSAPSHKALIIPPCNFIPFETLEKIIQLAKNGATVIFQGFPKDVPGLNDLAKRRTRFKKFYPG